MKKKKNVIHIKHTKIENECMKELYLDENIIITPADIYNVFHKPKSILKAQISSKNSGAEEIALKNENNNTLSNQKNFEPLKV